MQIGCFLSCEEFGPRDLVEQAKRAEQAGFHALWISDHYHPWNDAQGHSAFVWSVIGAIAEATDLPVTTGVTCPTVRIHPAIIAQAAATSAVMLEGRFNLGVGSGEALNEHILGDHWPEADVRLEMLREAVEVMRTLWEGGQQSHYGHHYAVENARIYDLPETPPPVIVSGFGPKAVRLAAEIGDGFATTSPDKESIDLYRSEGGKGPGARRHQGLLHGRRGRGRGRPCTACGRTRRCRASSPRSCRRRRTSSRRASSSRPTCSRRPWARTSTPTRRRCRSTRTRASTSCSCSRSAPTRTRSSRPGRSRSCRGSLG